MKIRIRDNSLRLRITLRELEHLAAEGKLRSEMHCLANSGPAGLFGYEIAVDATLAESDAAVEAFCIRLTLSRADLQSLLKPDHEGIYLKREIDGPGGIQRFIAMLEKDRPGVACEKPEEWVYEDRPGSRPETRSIEQCPVGGSTP